MSSLWLVVLELISLAGEKGSLGEGMWDGGTALGCSRGDLPSLKEEDREARQCSWGWLELELMEELACLLSGQREEEDVTHPLCDHPSQQGAQPELPAPLVTWEARGSRVRQAGEGPTVVLLHAARREGIEGPRERSQALALCH